MSRVSSTKGDNRDIGTWYTEPAVGQDLRPRGFSVSEDKAGDEGSSRWSVASRYMQAVRSGPEEIPDHIMVKNPNFPKDDHASPYTLFFYDVTAPNPVLLDNDVGRDIRKLRKNKFKGAEERKKT